jgi:hypothetical protein
MKEIHEGLIEQLRNSVMIIRETEDEAKKLYHKGRANGIKLSLMALGYKLEDLYIEE